MAGRGRQELRDLADAVRLRPLDEVAPLLGYVRDPVDRTRWRRDGSVLSVTGVRYFDHLQGRGGGGAIDLVVHARGCMPSAAIRWLAGLPSAPAPTTGTSIRVRSRQTAFVPPSPCARNWPRVRAWLLEERGLEAFRVDGLHAAGLLRADARGNAVFLCRDIRGRITGAELVGTRRMADGRRFRGLATGTRRSAGGFRIGPEDADPRFGTVFLAESAIDALSALSLGVGGLVSFYASAAGICRHLPDWLHDADPAAIVCGFDADAAGDAAATALAAADRRVRRIRPDGAKDWNALLQRDGVWALTGGLPPSPYGSGS